MRYLPLAIRMLILGLMVLTGCGGAPARVRLTPTPGPSTVEVLLSNLDNPRGVAIGSAGELFVAEAGTGYAAVDPTRMTGKLTKFTDRNNDGDFVDVGEVERWFNHLPTYNAQNFADSLQDEVGGPTDLILHGDRRLFLTVDGGFDKRNLFEISPEGRLGRSLADRSNMNSIAFAPGQERIYVAESMLNQVTEITLAGGQREIVTFPLLDSGQQPVPAGLAVDPRTGDLLVALFSGAVGDNETGEIIWFVPGEAKVVRVNPETGQFNDEITGLTTAVDVAVDDTGNIFVVELTTSFVEPFPNNFDFFDPAAPVLHGGYKRFSGRVTLYPGEGGSPRVLAAGLDTPTNITLGPDGALYISTGQGTPGRPIPGPFGPARIVGELIRITNF